MIRRLIDSGEIAAIDLKVSVDRLPGRFYEYARDWLELATTRLLAEPLFVEQPHRTVQSRLLSSCRREDDLVWLVRLNDSARWSDNTPITGEDVIRQLLRARSAQAGSLTAALMIKSLRLVSTDAIRFETRIPTAHLECILASPGLAPRDPSGRLSSGPFRITNSSNDSLRLSQLQPDSKSLALIRAPEHLNDNFFLKGNVDVSGPMSTGAATWRAVSKDQTSTVVPLDVVYGVILPKRLTNAAKNTIHRNIDRGVICEAAKGGSHLLFARDEFVE